MSSLTAGTVPVYTLAPLDYRYALDAARTLLTEQRGLEVWNNLPMLSDEITQRFSDWPGISDPTNYLWIEPLIGDWQPRLADITPGLQKGGRLLVLTSQPLAGRLPERRDWPASPSRGQVRLWRAALQGSGLRRAERYHIHSLAAIGLSQLAGVAGRLGRVALADRLGFAGRRYYAGSDWWCGPATVELWVIEGASQ